MNYIGIDQSFTCTGIIVLDENGEFQFSQALKPKGKGVERLSNVYFSIINLTNQFPSGIFATEGYSYLSGQKKNGKPYGKQAQAGEIKGIIDLALYNQGKISVSYQPRQHRAKTIQYQKGDKEVIVNLVNTRFGMDFKKKDHNLADAYTIARALYQDVDRMKNIYGTELFDKFITNTPFQHLSEVQMVKFTERFL